MRLEEVLGDVSLRHLGVGPGAPVISGVVEAKETFHRAKALLDPEPAP